MDTFCNKSGYITKKNVWLLSNKGHELLSKCQKKKLEGKKSFLAVFHCNGL